MPLPQTNLHAHFTAKQGTTIVSDGLDQWEDQVGSGSADAPSASERPATNVETLNSVAVPSFDGSDDVLDMPSFSGGIINETSNDGVITVGAVIKRPAGQSNGYMWDGSNGINRQGCYNGDTNIVIRSGTDQDFIGVSADTWFRVIVKYKTEGNSETWIDGTLEDNTNSVGISGMDGVTFGQRQDGFGHGEFALAEWVVYDGDADESAIDSYFQDEWFTASDETAPTVGDSTLTEDDVKSSSVTIGFNKATDETSAQSALVYKLYRAGSGASIDTLANIDANGTQVASDTDVSSLTDNTVDGATTYEYNVTVEDEAGNRLAYTQEQVETLNTISGVITRNGSAQSGVEVRIETVDDLDDFSNATEVDQVTTDANGVYEMTVAYNADKHYLVTPLYFHQLHTGTAESGTANTLTDTDQSFTASEFNDKSYVIRTTGGTGSGQERRIIDNTATEITVEIDWDTNPDATTTYEIGQMYSAGPKVHVASN